VEEKKRNHGRPKTGQVYTAMRHIRFKPEEWDEATLLAKRLGYIGMSEFVRDLVREKVNEFRKKGVI